MLPLQPDRKSQQLNIILTANSEFVLEVKPSIRSELNLVSRIQCAHKINCEKWHQFLFCQSQIV